MTETFLQGIVLLLAIYYYSGIPMHRKGGPPCSGSDSRSWTSSGGCEDSRGTVRDGAGDSGPNFNKERPC